jgi:acetyltransferase-like isoleucine patch superfamily enzyme
MLLPARGYAGPHGRDRLQSRGGVKAPELAGPVVIGEDVFVGRHCVILPNLRIGDRSVIRAGSVVSHNVPPNSLFGSQSETVLRQSVGAADERAHVRGARARGCGRPAPLSAASSRPA